MGYGGSSWPGFWPAQCVAHYRAQLAVPTLGTAEYDGHCRDNYMQVIHHASVAVDV